MARNNSRSPRSHVFSFKRNTTKPTAKTAKPKRLCSRNCRRISEIKENDVISETEASSDSSTLEETLDEIISDNDSDNDSDIESSMEEKEKPMKETEMAPVEINEEKDEKEKEKPHPQESHRITYILHQSDYSYDYCKCDEINPKFTIAETKQYAQQRCDDDVDMTRLLFAMKNEEFKHVKEIPFCQECAKKLKIYRIYERVPNISLHCGGCGKETSFVLSCISYPIIGYIVNQSFPMVNFKTSSFIFNLHELKTALMIIRHHRDNIVCFGDKFVSLINCLLSQVYDSVVIHHKNMMCGRSLSQISVISDLNVAINAIKISLMLFENLLECDNVLIKMDVAKNTLIAAILNIYNVISENSTLRCITHNESTILLDYIVNKFRYSADFGLVINKIRTNLDSDIIGICYNHIERVLHSCGLSESVIKDTIKNEVVRHLVLNAQCMTVELQHGHNISNTVPMPHQLQFGQFNKLQMNNGRIINQHVVKPSSILSFNPQFANTLSKKNDNEKK